MLVEPHERAVYVDLLDRVQGHSHRARDQRDARPAVAMNLAYSVGRGGATSGIPATDVARFGGTSLAMLERTYAHLLTSSAESARARLDAFAAEQEQAAESRFDRTLIDL